MRGPQRKAAAQFVVLHDVDGTELNRDLGRQTGGDHLVYGAVNARDVRHEIMDGEHAEPGKVQPLDQLITHAAKARYIDQRDAARQVGGGGHVGVLVYGVGLLREDAGTTNGAGQRPTDQGECAHGGIESIDIAWPIERVHHGQSDVHFVGFHAAGNSEHRSDTRVNGQSDARACVVDCLDGFRGVLCHVINGHHAHASSSTF